MISYWWFKNEKVIPNLIKLSMKYTWRLGLTMCLKKGDLKLKLWNVFGIAIWFKTKLISDLKQ